MAFELLLIAFTIGIGTFLIAIPSYKMVKALIPPKRNPLEEAQDRLEQARLEAEAARLNKEAESLYKNMYQEVMDEDYEKEQRRL